MRKKETGARRPRVNDPAVVVLSGGQDSMTALALAIENGHAGNIHTLSFHYGQRHSVELEQARAIAHLWSTTHHEVRIDQLRQLVKSALLNHSDDVNASHGRLKDLPASFVPARNALFFTLAHALACEIGAKTVYTGVCQTDYSGYPDCRMAFVKQLEQALNVGYEADVHIFAPFMYANKAETFAVAADLGVLDLIIEHSHTCYNGDRIHRHEWGYGCGACPACQLRAKGYEAFKAGDVDISKLLDGVEG